jgi:hypothetical protein
MRQLGAPCHALLELFATLRAPGLRRLPCVATLELGLQWRSELLPHGTPAKLRAVRSSDACLRKTDTCRVFETLAKGIPLVGFRLASALPGCFIRTQLARGAGRRGRYGTMAAFTP